MLACKFCRYFFGFPWLKVLIAGMSGKELLENKVNESLKQECLIKNIWVFEERNLSWKVSEISGISAKSYLKRSQHNNTIP